MLVGMKTPWYPGDNTAGDIAQFTKWFARCGMDFSISYIGGTWKCTAWLTGTRGDGAGIRSWSSGPCDSPTTALHVCYNEVRKPQRTSA